MNLTPIAIWILKRSLKNKDYREVWQSNIAVCMQDASHGKVKDIWKISNDGAKRFIDLLIK